MRIACIGSRDITPLQEELFEAIGEWIVSEGHYISSGAADGSDASFMIGGNKVAPERVIAYLPWPKYNNQYIHPGNRVLYQPYPQWEELSKPFHGAWDKLSQGARKLMARNWGIVHRADKVIALLNHRKPGGGGTGQGWRIAGHLNIPRLDLNDKSFDEVVDFILQ